MQSDRKGFRNISKEIKEYKSTLEALRSIIDIAEKKSVIRRVSFSSSPKIQTKI